MDQFKKQNRAQNILRGMIAKKNRKTDESTYD